MAVALLALFVALGGTGYAVTTINGKNLKNRSVAATKLKANQVGGAEIDESKLAKVPSAKQADSAANAAHATSADNADVAANSNTAVSAQTAASAGHATTADTASNVSKVGGVDAAKLNVAGEGAAASCDPDKTNLFQGPCATATLDLPATSSVLVIASGGWYGFSGVANGTCDLGVAQPAGGRSVSLGEALTAHNAAANSGAWSVNDLFTGVPAGTTQFNVTCFEGSGDLRITSAHITAVRLAS
jgi:hypothetical protein